MRIRHIPRASSARLAPFGLSVLLAACGAPSDVHENAMPDTITTPTDALARLRDRYLATGADLALAVFPAAEPERLGPVLLDGERVLHVLDKPDRPPVSNTWGAAIWSDAFADLMHEGLSQPPADGREPVIGHFFDQAVQRGLKVIGVPITDGSFEDAGTRVGILRCLDASAPKSAAPASAARTPALHLASH